jgi:environmental stress-induced protein Ves
MEAPDGTTATADSFILGILWNDPVWRNKSAGTCQEIWHFPGKRSTLCWRVSTANQTRTPNPLISLRKVT